MTAVHQRKLKFNRCEMEMISMLSVGKKQREIAKHFSSTEAAVSHWLKAARRYAEASTNEQLVAIAMRQGIIQ